MVVHSTEHSKNKRHNFCQTDKQRQTTATAAKKESKENEKKRKKNETNFPHYAYII